MKSLKYSFVGLFSDILTTKYDTVKLLKKWLMIINVNDMVMTRHWQVKINTN